MLELGPGKENEPEVRDRASAARQNGTSRTCVCPTRRVTIRPVSPVGASIPVAQDLPDALLVGNLSRCLAARVEPLLKIADLHMVLGSGARRLRMGQGYTDRVRSR